MITAGLLNTIPCRTRFLSAPRVRIRVSQRQNQRSPWRQNRRNCCSFKPALTAGGDNAFVAPRATKCDEQSRLKAVPGGDPISAKLNQDECFLALVPVFGHFARIAVD